MSERDVTDAALAAERDLADLRAAASAQVNDELLERIRELETSLAAYQTKPIPRGIFTRQSLNPAGVSTLQLHWSSAEPTRGLFDFSSLDALLAKAPPAACRLRPYLGASAPVWAKELGSGPITYTEPQSAETLEIPDVWDPTYQEAAAAFIAEIAARYDDDDRVALVFATAAMTYYAEPFIRGVTNADNRRRLLDAGYTPEADRAAQVWQLDIMEAFTRTNIGCAYNPWQYVRPDGTAANSVEFMATIMDHHLDVFGARAVLQNNSIRSSYIANTPAFYAEFTARPEACHQFQCAAAARVGDEAATIRWAIDSLGASGIEHSGTLSEAQYAAFDQELRS